VLRVRKRGAHFSKLGGESEVWGMKVRDTMVVDNEKVKVEEKGHSGEGERRSGHEIVWNDVGGNRRGSAKRNEDLKNHEECVGEEQKEWGVGVQWEVRSHPQPNRDVKPAEPETVSPWQQMFACQH